MKKRSTWIVIVVVLAAGAGLFLAFRPKDKVPKYKLEKVTRGDIQESVFASGTINAITSVAVGTQVSGRIKEIHVDFNSPVKKGQLIALVDPAVYEAQVLQARANYISAKANVDRAQAQLTDARRGFDRASELFQRDLIAKSDRDSAETNYQSLVAGEGVAQAQMMQAEAALGLAETNLKYTRVISPVDGVVISRAVDVGQTVVASFQSPTLFTIAQDLTQMQIDTNVNEADIGKVAEGQAVEFTVDAYSDLTFQGTVAQVRNAPMTVSNVVTYDVVIKVDNPELKLKPGMTANTTIVTASRKNALRIPNAALRFVPENEENRKSFQKGYSVWTLKDKEPSRVPVKIGISDDSFTELVEGELKEGQELIISSLDKKGQGRGPRMF